MAELYIGDVTLGDGPADLIRTGAWWVGPVGVEGATGWPECRVFALRDTGEQASARLTRFPIGWRVGQHWTADVPNTVRAAARRVARRMTAAGL